jgi:hypothetical protein
MSSFTSSKVNVSIKRQLYLLIHHSAADLSMLSDFESFKTELSLVNKTFVTMGKPLVVEGLDVKIRDTQLLAPGGRKSLASLSTLYPNIRKIEISKEDITNMKSLWDRDPQLFKDYAMRDSVITLVHGCSMAHSNQELGGQGVPITISSLSGRYLKKCWKEIGYPGYQPFPHILIGDASSLQTPRGLAQTSNLGLNLNYYVGSFKGGRNESFMYGVDREHTWYDYDFTSAYTTVMAMMGHPVYEDLKILTSEELEKMSKSEILNSYLVIHCDFKFPENVKYPSLSCFTGSSSTVYPLSGQSIITGSEYLVALTQKCEFSIHKIVYIPWSKTVQPPFYKAIHNLQEMRRKHAKGTFLNLLYKEEANSLYGMTARGISVKKHFDVKSGKPVKLDVNDFANPLLCTWITGYIRGLVGEFLSYVSKEQGLAASVTTDGFITNLAGLETKNFSGNDDFLLYNQYCDTRKHLSGELFGLEVKNSGKNLLV